MRLVLGLLVPLLLAITPPAVGGEVLPNGTYHYQTSIGGKPVGSSTLVVDRDAGNVNVGESGEMLGQALTSRRTLVAATFKTLSYTVDARGKHAVLDITGSEATLTQDGKSVKIAAPSDAPFLVSDNMAAGFALIPATLHVTQAKQLTMACLCGSFVAVPLTTGSATATRPAGVPATARSFTITVQGADATLWFDPSTFVLDRFDFPSQQLSMTLQSYDSAVTALPKPVAPSPLPLPSPNYTARDVAIRADDGVTLRGTLTMPEGVSKPVPGFVLVHGSGCNDRDETIGPNKIFAQLANRLSNDGYAVLRYDKRSCGQSGGTFPVRNRLIADARDAIAYLRAQRGVDPKQIYVLGHSEGGELVPSVAIQDGHLRGIVLLAPPALPLEQILMQQMLRNVTGADRIALAKEERAELDAIAEGKKSGTSARWLRSSFGIDPATLIVRVPCPILIVQGTKDIQVLPPTRRGSSPPPTQRIAI